MLGVLLCFVLTAASAAGALFVLEALLTCPDRGNIVMLSDVGQRLLGRTGATVVLTMQMLNFGLYLPIALLTTAEAFQDFVEPTGATCTNYFIFAVSLVCFLSTQVRELRNASALAGVSLFASLGVAILQLVVVASTLEAMPEAGIGGGGGGYTPVAVPNEEGDGGGVVAGIEMALALTTCAWAYVPCLLVTELAHEMPERPERMRRSIFLSAAMNIVVFLAVGIPVAAMWGGDVSDPITKSARWPKEHAAARAMSALLALANFVAYCLDSVPLARWCQRRFLPEFRGGWGWRDVRSYALACCPTFVFAVFASVFVGQPGGLFTMLAWVTALTVPALNQIVPAALVLCGRGTGKVGGTLNGRTQTAVTAAAWCVLAAGVGSLLVCLYGAVGKSANAEVRGPQVIGCKGWEIYHSNGTVFKGWG